MRIDATWTVTFDAATAGIDRLSGALAASVRGSGAWTIVTIAGEMDMRAMALVRNAVRTDARLVVFDLRQVTFMDTCGLEVLAKSQRDAQLAGGCLRLVAPSRKVRRVLMLTGANREFTTFASSDEAMAAPVPAVDGRDRGRPLRRLHRATGRRARQAPCAGRRAPSAD